jgi:ubiquinone/menaquinone biosynthesis C-methylase UbiE
MIKKLTYVEVVKISLNDNTNKTPISKNLIKNTYKKSNNWINILLSKILKQEKLNPNYKSLVNDSYNELQKINTQNNQTMQIIYDLNNIFKSYSVNKLIKNVNINHEWVSLNLTQIIKNYCTNYCTNYLDINNINNKYKIVDIGGGEGDVLNMIGTHLNIPQSNLYCIESKNEWSEYYNFAKNINYIFWDNNYIDIDNDSIDVIIIMVAMHHMSDQNINNLLSNAYRILNPNGIIIIKEHDLNILDLKQIIDWEHHLYHIISTSNDNLTQDKITNYLDNFINNYKSKEEFDKYFTNYGFKSIIELDRSFKIKIKDDIANVSNLYWKIYQKK